MITSMKCVCAATMIAVIFGSALPASAQTSTAGVNPTFLPGDPSAEAIAGACGIGPDDIRFSLSLSPVASPPPSQFSATFTVSGDTLAFTDTSSPPDQFNGTKGIEVVAVRRNGTHVYCYADQVSDSQLDPPGNGAPNQVTVVWGPGPCPFTDAELAPICSAYESLLDPESTESVFLQGHVVGASQPVNICGCPPAEALFCDEETVGSCVPAGEGPFAGSEFTGSATAGTNTCEQVTTTVGGRLRTMTVCN